MMHDPYLPRVRAIIDRLSQRQAPQCLRPTADPAFGVCGITTCPPPNWLYRSPWNRRRA